MGLMRQTLFNHVKMLFPNVNSFLWQGELANNRAHRIEKIVKEILRIAPYSDPRHEELAYFVYTRMSETRYDKYRKRWSKPHRADLYKALIREHEKQHSDKRKVKKKIRQLEKDLEVEKAASRFGWELGIEVYYKNAPKTDNEYKNKTKQYISIIKELEQLGNYAGAQSVKNNLPPCEPTFKDIAEKLKQKYLSSKAYAHFPRQYFRKLLQERARNAKRLLYSQRSNRPKK